MKGKANKTVVPILFYALESLGELFKKIYVQITYPLYQYFQDV